MYLKNEDAKERYSDFILTTEHFSYGDCRWHVRCNVYDLHGKKVAVCKTKKEAKELIKAGCFNPLCDESF